MRFSATSSTASPTSLNSRHSSSVHSPMRRIGGGRIEGAAGASSRDSHLYENRVQVLLDVLRERSGPSTPGTRCSRPSPPSRSSSAGALHGFLHLVAEDALRVGRGDRWTNPASVGLPRRSPNIPTRPIARMLSSRRSILKSGRWGSDAVPRDGAQPMANGRQLGRADRQGRECDGDRAFFAGLFPPFEIYPVGSRPLRRPRFSHRHAETR